MLPPILIVSAFLPSPISLQAGQRTAFRNLCVFAKKYRIYLLVFVSESDLGVSDSYVRDVCEEVYFFRASKWARILGYLQRPHLPVMASTRWNREFLSKCKALLTQYSISRVHLEWVQVGAYVWEFPSSIKVSLYVHDVLSQLYLRRWCNSFSIIDYLEYSRMVEWERDVLRNCDFIYVPSNKDLRLVVSCGVESSRCSVVPLAISKYSNATVGDIGSSGISLLFWGAMNRRENIGAVTWICQSLLPELDRRGCCYTFTCVGSKPPESLLEYSNSKISFTGFLLDPSPLFKSAHLAVLPLFEGAGVKVKVLECINSGIPVLTSSVGGEGIDTLSISGLNIREISVSSYADFICEASNNIAALKQQSLSCLNSSVDNGLDLMTSLN